MDLREGEDTFGDTKYGGIDPNGKSNAQLWRRAHMDHNTNRERSIRKWATVNGVYCVRLRNQ